MSNKGSNCSFGIKNEFTFSKKQQNPLRDWNSGCTDDITRLTLYPLGNELSYMIPLIKSI